MKSCVMPEKWLEKEFVQRHIKSTVSRTGQRCERLGKTAAAAAAADSLTWHLALSDGWLFENKGFEENMRQRHK